MKRQLKQILNDYYLTMSNIDRSEFYNIKFQKTFNDLDLDISCNLNHWRVNEDFKNVSNN